MIVYLKYFINFIYKKNQLFNYLLTIIIMMYLFINY